MREEIADLVHPVIYRGVYLKRQLDRGESPVLDTEHAVLKGFLLTDIEARRWVDFGGEGGPDFLQRGETSTEVVGRSSINYFLGVRYALACWLDEIFILDSPWESRWNERKLEAALYGTNDRAWKFWEQASLAESRPGTDALEVFFLCVMLGFRGELRDDPARLQQWVTATRARIAKSQRRSWPYPPEIDPPTYVPPLRGKDRLRRMIVIGGTVLLFIIPIIVFVVMDQLGN